MGHRLLISGSHCVCNFRHGLHRPTLCATLCLPGNRNLTDAGFLGVTRLAGSLTALVLQGGHEVTENGATALAALTGLQSLSLAFR